MKTLILKERYHKSFVISLVISSYKLMAIDQCSKSRLLIAVSCSL
ncbi:MAG TPA: hypothetical protein PK762_12770 [Candidatus Kapabacteria bacterium]|nr:hypothetical protein [Candidatus Kapabacteria bacterium]